MRVSKAFHFIYAFFLLSAVVLNSGCSLDASILTSVDEMFLNKVSGKEIVPGSNQNVVTENGYVVQSSLSFHSGGAETVVTTDQYRVETGSQSILFKKE